MLYQTLLDGVGGWRVSQFLFSGHISKGLFGYLVCFILYEEVLRISRFILNVYQSEKGIESKLNHREIIIRGLVGVFSTHFFLFDVKRLIKSSIVFASARIDC